MTLRIGLLPAQQAISQGCDPPAKEKFTHHALTRTHTYRPTLRIIVFPDNFQVTAHMVSLLFHFVHLMAQKQVKQK
ncbi:hypothetical protein HOLleu_27293 [Holothuria leucospilota]|uniref:Uncharacterized protein n=1 Tax=Holothuria leucospilota TaxID=206669 RepID=A0A9Q1BQ65_HOLLE|nr:hypothetical protein HOLleu_27293 [Holothuria leucospilota]